MPKGKVQIGTSRKSRNVRRKFKLGGRKQAVSALALSTDELLKKFESPSRGRDKGKIQQVLNMRGILDIKGAIAERNTVEETA